MAHLVLWVTTRTHTPPWFSSILLTETWLLMHYVIAPKFMLQHQSDKFPALTQTTKLWKGMKYSCCCWNVSNSIPRPSGRKCSLGGVSTAEKKSKVRITEKKHPLPGGRKPDVFSAAPFHRAREYSSCQVSCLLCKARAPN